MADTAELTVGQLFMELLKAILRKLVELLAKASAAAGEYAKNKAAKMDAASGAQ